MWGFFWSTYAAAHLLSYTLASSLTNISPIRLPCSIVAQLEWFWSVPSGHECTCYCLLAVVCLFLATDIWIQPLWSYFSAVGTSYSAGFMIRLDSCLVHPHFRLEFHLMVHGIWGWDNCGMYLSLLCGQVQPSTDNQSAVIAVQCKDSEGWVLSWFLQAVAHIYWLFIGIMV